MQTAREIQDAGHDKGDLAPCLNSIIIWFRVFEAVDLSMEE